MTAFSYNLEESRSNNALCKNCQKPIISNYRLRTYLGGYICLKCGDELIKYEISELLKVLKNVRKSKKEHRYNMLNVQ